MPQMSPLGWAWITAFVIMVWFFYVVGFYFLFVCFMSFSYEGMAFWVMSWEW